MPLRLTEIVKTCTALLLMICTSTAWAANQSRFSVQEVHEDSNGVTLTTIAGLMRIEACGDRVIHVVVSSTAELPNPTVPVVTKPCGGESLKVVVGKKEVVLRTPAVTVNVDRTTGALTFLTKDGESVLAEPKGGGKAFDIPSLFETKTWQVQQTFSLAVRRSVVWSRPASGRYFQRPRCPGPTASSEHQYFDSLHAIQ